MEFLKNIKTKFPEIPMLMITGNSGKYGKESVMEAGADGFISKPFDPNELKSSVKSGIRILDLELELSGKIRELKEALDHVKRLQGLPPICMYCKKIRDDTDTWRNIEIYIEEHSEALFTHSICHECKRKHYPNFAEEITKF